MGTTGEALIHLIKTKIGNPKTGLEIGVSRARTSRRLLRAFPDLHLYLIDPYERYKDHSNNRKVNQRQQHRRKTTALKALKPFEDRYDLIEDYSYRVSWQIPDNSLDFIFIDGLHTAIGTMIDILLYAQKIKKGGLLCGHDFNRETVKDAVISYKNLNAVGNIKVTRNFIWYYE